MITVLYGSDRYFLDAKVRELCLKDQATQQLKPLVYDASRPGFSYDFLFEEIMTVSLFESSKCVVLVNPLAQHAQSMSVAQHNTWKQICSQLPKEVELFVLIEASRFDSKDKVIAPALAHGKKLEVPGLKTHQMQAIIKQISKEKGLKIDEQTLAYLATQLPTYMPTILNELEKLASYPDAVSKQVIRSLIKQPLQDNVFELSKAIMIKNLTLAYQIYQDLTTLKHDPVSLIPAIAWQYRLMFQILNYQQQKLSIAAIKEKLQISDYVFDKALQYASLTNQQQVMELLDSLAQLDQDIKTGRKDKQLGFEMFLIQAMR